jgi:hypothetical protein
MRRIPILLLLAAAPLAAHAETASTPQDRYGPPSAAAARDAAPAQAQGVQDAPPPKTLLKWTGKDRPARIAAVATAPAAAPAAQVQPQAPARLAARPAAVQAPARPQPVTQLLGGPPTPAAAPSIYAPPVRMAAAVAPASQTVAQPAPAPVQPPAAAPSRGPRLYSVAREFGMQPDPTPVAVHNRDGAGMILAEVPTNDAPPEQTLPERRRVTSAAGQTTIIERPRSTDAN